MAPLISCKDWSFETILALGDHIKPIPRVGVLAEEASLFKAISLAESKGEPLVIDSFHKVETWDHQLFTPEWVIKHAKPNIITRNVHNWSDIELRTDEFFAKTREAPAYIIPGETERLYAKDVHCPEEWLDFLYSGNCPPQLLPSGQNDYMIPEKVQTLMCYFGIGDTSTPAHKDLCASSGQNLMVYSEHGGSAFWFMTRSSDARRASDYFHKLGHELDHENMYLTLDIMSQAPFDIFVTEQKVGDFIMVPPRSCHQVMNRGGLSMKVSWSRMTLSGLHAALYHELPLYQRVCRPEIYQIKATIYHSLQTVMDILEQLYVGNLPEYRFGIHSGEKTMPITLMGEYCRILQSLLALYDDILVDECPPDDAANEVASSEEHFTCDFCGADIFQGFLECRTCVTSHRDSSYTLCAGCFVDGRSCTCRNMTPQQCRPFQVLLDRRQQVLDCLRKMGSFPQITTALQKPQDSPYGLFRAAYLIWQARKAAPKQLRACSAKNPSHWIPISDALFCRVCHGSRCYEHIMDRYSVHSSIAVFVHNESPTHKPWHQFHQESRKNRSRGDDALLIAQSQGVKPDIRASRSWIAMTFRVSQPMSPNSVLGWYDDDLEGFKSYTADLVQEESLDELSDATSASVSVPLVTKEAKPKRKRKNDSAQSAPQKKPRPSQDIPKPSNDGELSDKPPDTVPKAAKRNRRKKPAPVTSASPLQESVVEAESVSAPVQTNRKRNSKPKGSTGDDPPPESAHKPFESISMPLTNGRAEKEQHPVKCPAPVHPPPPSGHETLNQIISLSGTIQSLQGDLSKLREALDKESQRASTSIPTSVEGVADLVRETLDAEGITALVNLLRPPAPVSERHVSPPKSYIDLTGAVASRPHSPDRYQTPVNPSPASRSDDVSNRPEPESRPPNRRSSSRSRSLSRLPERSPYSRRSEARLPDQTSVSPSINPSNSQQQQHNRSNPNQRDRKHWQKKHYKARGRPTQGPESPNKWRQGRQETNGTPMWSNDSRQASSASHGPSSHGPSHGSYSNSYAGQQPTSWSGPSSSRSWNRAPSGNSASTSASGAGWNDHSRSSRGWNAQPPPQHSRPRGWSTSNGWH